jgi:hypothetical protein
VRQALTAYLEDVSPVAFEQLHHQLLNGAQLLVHRKGEFQCLCYTESQTAFMEQVKK